MVFENNLSPVIFKTELFGVTIEPRWYGLAYVIGFILGYIWLFKAIKAGKIPGFDPEKLDALMFGLILGVIIGGRLGYCLQHIDIWREDPLFFFRFNQGGMAFFGGLVGVVLVIVGFCRKYKIKFGRIGDVVTVPAALALGIGRIANFINGELWGVPTFADWGVIYPNSGDRQLRHPSELYEMATHFLLAGMLVVFKRSRFAQSPGAASAFFVFGYGLLRIITEKFRSSDRFLGPLTNGQVASIVIAIIGLAILLIILRRSDSKEALTPQGSEGNE
ncbi:prolipoprotein diacylglyceryl transferase [Kamptonema cortianum]|nr:prolipoprotein diacylglyceryl transferase [Geitlerinema splendidum]MDK3155962.1 prolipoprotein diacylglyceryl transferase [Kamptonema cortianum]